MTAVLLDAVLLATSWGHVLLAPYTKVEESFNLHATHDVLIYGVKPAALANYDHFIFPGPVPRTFVGSVLLAWLSTPVLWIAGHFGLIQSKFDIQVVVRLVLASVNALGLCLIQRAVSRRFGRLASLFFTLFTISQFHLPFWMGRTLPNMFALFPVNVSTYLILDRAPAATRPSKTQVNMAISLLTFTAVVFRAEVALLLAPLAIQCLYLRYITFTSLVKTGLLSGILSLFLTVSVDSYFWHQYPVWPEFSGIYFNVFQGKSAQWGVDPPLTYFLAHIPKMTMSCAALAVLGVLIDHRIRSFMFPAICFVTIISFLGHKEWRFIIYVVPVFNVAAARSAKWMAGRGKNRLAGRLLFASIFGLVALHLFFTTIHTAASIANYPGGEAIMLFNDRYAGASAPPHVHICNLAAQTGASLFSQVHDDWTYDKTEGLSLAKLTWSQTNTHLIAEPANPPRGWRVAETFDGFAGWQTDWKTLGNVWDVVWMSKRTQLVIMERV